MLYTDWNSRLRPNTEFYFETLNWLFERPLSTYRKIIWIIYEQPYHNVYQRCTNPGHQIAVAIKLCAVALHNFLGGFQFVICFMSPFWNLDV